MTYSVVKEEWKHLTYLVRLAMLICDFIWVQAVYKTLNKGFQFKLVIASVVIFALLLYGTYLTFRTPYFCIPMSRYYDAKALKKSIENDSFEVLKENKIWVSEHWLKIQNIFLPKSLICQLSGSVTSATIMMIRTIDNKEYVLYHMGHLKRQQEEEMIGSTLPLVSLLDEKGYDGQKVITRLSCVPKPYLEEMLKLYLSNHSVEDLINTTDLMEMYVKEYDRIMSGGRKKKKKK